MRDCPEDCPKQGTYHEHERSVNCRGSAADCFGYYGAYDLHTCLADNHDMDSEPANGRVPCRAGDKRWAEPDTLVCRIHREAAARPPVPAHRAPWPA